jgi:hypothetical protein
MVVLPKAGKYFHSDCGDVAIGTPQGYTVTEADTFGDFLEEAAAQDFTYFRPVLRFDVTKEGDPGDVEIWVKWTQRDGKFAAIEGFPTLKIQFDGPWKTAADDHTVHMVPDRKGLGGTALLVIKDDDWGDPRIGWAD